MNHKPWYPQREQTFPLQVRRSSNSLPVYLKRRLGRCQIHCDPAGWAKFERVLVEANVRCVKGQGATNSLRMRDASDGLQERYSYGYIQERWRAEPHQGGRVAYRETERIPVQLWDAFVNNATH